MTTNRTQGIARRHLLQAAATSTLGPMLLPRAARAETPAPQTTPKSFADVVRQRAMIRVYKSELVSEEKIQQLLKYAARAPSGGNLQPWEFVVVKNPEVRAKLAKAAMDQTSVATAPVIIVTCADIQRAGSQVGTRGSFISLVDTAFASLLILLGAIEQGLGACFVASYDAEEVAKLFGLPPHVRPVGLITVGYPAEAPRKPTTKKIPLKKLVHVDKW
jgi:nitroreductase